MKKKLKKGTYGYLNANKVRAWKLSAAMLSVPVVIFIISWIINGTRMNAMTVVAILGCLPGCNQVVRAIMASRYHSIDKKLYQNTEEARGDRLALYECVFTSYEKNYYVDALVISGREIIGYTTDEKMDVKQAADHIKSIMQANEYKQNVKIVKEEHAFLERVHTLAANKPEDTGFTEDERYPGFSRDEIIQSILMAISL